MRECGGHLMANHPPLGLVDVFAATLPTLDFVPGVHVNYAETVLPMRDGLPEAEGLPGGIRRFRRCHRRIAAPSTADVFLAELAASSCDSQ